MRLKTTPEKKPFESILPLINVVFLMLIFFLVAGTLKPFAELDVQPPEIAEGAAGKQARDIVLIDKVGQIAFEGVLITSEELGQKLARRVQDGEAGRIKVLADKALPALKLVDVLAMMTRAGARHISLITARGTAP